MSALEEYNDWYEDDDMVAVPGRIAAAMRDELLAEVERLLEQVRSERRLRQYADSALAQMRSHPNSKLDNVARYYYELGQRAQCKEEK